MTKRKALYPRAWLILALFALTALGLLLWPSEGQSGNAGDARAFEGVALASSAISGGDAEGLAQALSEKSLSRYEVEPSEGVKGEVPFRSGALCSVGSDGIVVGFTLKNGESFVFDQVRTEMEAKGWTYVSSGNKAAATFAKDVGAYRWATVTCTEAASGVAVVINARGCDER